MKRILISLLASVFGLGSRAVFGQTLRVPFFGTYTVDAKKHVVTRHVGGSMAWHRTTPTPIQPRIFKLEGNRLEIGYGKTERRVLERVR